MKTAKVDRMERSTPHISAARVRDLRIDSKFAFDLSELGEVGPFGESKHREFIADGRLKARRADKKIVVLASDYIAFLQSLPIAEIGDSPFKKQSGSGGAQ